MSKKSKSQKAQQAKKPALSRRNFILLSAGTMAIGGTAFGLNALEMNHRELHDLSVIGQGKPVIVQIHDPKCPTCRRLKNIMKNTLKQDTPHYRLADITSAEGKALQQKYDVPNVTLLYFDEDGKHVHTTQGLQTSDAIKSTVSRLFGTHT